MQDSQPRPRFVPLIPILVFLGLYCSVGLYLTWKGHEMAFYQFPAPSCALIAFAVALMVGHRQVNMHVKTFANGIGEETVVLMCLIFLLAGAFAKLAEQVGAVKSTVDLCLAFLPAAMILPGLFVAACLVSLAMGTSMGTIAAMAPIAIGIAQEGHMELPLILGALVSGAMFGDNLSVISDTTIAATSTQGCQMREKMRYNLRPALVAALLSAVLFFVLSPLVSLPDLAPAAPFKIVPYALVFILALWGVNVVVVLMIGITLMAFVGLFDGSLAFVQLGQSIYQGFMSMADVFFTSVLIAGLAAIAAKEGGLQWLFKRLQVFIKGPKSAELTTAAAVSLADIALANNTVAILLSGKMARQIAQENNVQPGKMASILDVYSCVWQGILPHGAQLLLVCGLVELSPFSIIPYVIYPFILGFVMTIMIVFSRRQLNA